MKSVVSSYVNLTKPTIVLLFGITGLAALVIEGSLLHDPFKLCVILLAIVLTAGSANALNMFFDRDIDVIMKRTRVKRAIPLKKVDPQSALRFGLVLGAIATALLLIFGNALAAFLGFFTIAFYVGVYTLFLKRRTPYNIVIGGAAGATAPLIGWAAATGHLSLAAWLLFLIIFMWTPPHFWALALVIKEDYREAKIPMLPVVAGDQRTRLEILGYTLALIPLTLAPTLNKIGGATYVFSGSLLGFLFLLQAYRLITRRDNKSAYRLFAYSIVYLLLLFSALMIGAAAHADANPFDAKFNTLEQKMTPPQVKNVLGPPDLREVVGDKEIWHYSAQGGRKLVFVKGKLQDFGKDDTQAPVAVAPTPTPPPSHLGIGESCNGDDQCASGNCHFGKCSGKNNCHVAIGKPCATNDDCCEGWCDFQRCKKK